MTNCGMRVGELLGLQWHDLDLVTGDLRIQRPLIWIAGDADEGVKDRLELVGYVKGKGRRKYRDVGSSARCPRGAAGASHQDAGAASRRRRRCTR